MPSPRLAPRSVFDAAFVALQADDFATGPRAARTGRSQSFPGQLAGLLHPSGELSFVQLLAFVDVEVADVLLLGRAGGERTQRRAAEERHLDVLREAVGA